MGRIIPLEQVLRRRRRHVWTWRIAVVLALACLSVADHRGWLLHRGDWVRYHDRTFAVTAVIDGDTIDIAAPDGDKSTTRIRLWGIDTPEMAKRDPDRPAQPFADQAKAMTYRLCQGKQVTLHLESHCLRGKYGRLLAHVRLPSGEVLNDILLERGLARADERFSHSRLSRYSRLVEQAQHDRLGIWAKAPPEQTPPDARTDQ